MSYAVGGTSARPNNNAGGSYQNDLEDPLMKKDARRHQISQIEAAFRKIRQSLGQLENMVGTIGTKSDSQQFRQKITKQLNEISNLIKENKKSIDVFDGLSRTDAVPTNQKSDHKYQVRNFQEQQGQFVAKLKQVSEQIMSRQTEFTETLERTRNSMVSDGINDQSADYADNQMQQQKFQLSDEDRRMEQDADFYNGVIKQRKEDIHAIADIMQDINSIAKDLAVEVKQGGEKLDQLNDQMADADKKAGDALKELQSAKKYNKKNSRCACCLFWIILIALGVLFIILWRVGVFDRSETTGGQ